VYFNSEEIELVLNGRSLGRRPATEPERYTATFAVPYEPGELRAVAWSAGRRVAEQVLRTAGPAVRLALEVDRTVLAADPDDLAYITVKALDAAGNGVPDAGHRVYFTVRGVGGLAAVGSADPCSTEPYRGNMRSLWRGRAMAILRPDGRTGELMLEAHADGLAGAAITVECRDTR